MHKPPDPQNDAPERDSPQQLRILVVDDDPLVAFGLTELLRDEGHQPVEAASAREALDKLAAQPFDVVVTDETMPDMTGRELARIVRQKWPEVGVVLSTGYTDLKDAEALPRLDKPFRPAQIRAALAQAARRR